MAHITVSKLFERHANDLNLHWVAGRIGGMRKITLDTTVLETPGNPTGVVDDLESTTSPASITEDTLIEYSPNKQLIGHLSLIHPNEIQVLGYTEIKYLNELHALSRREAIEKLMDSEPDLILLAENQEAPQLLEEMCEKTQTPLIVSSITSNKLVNDLHYYLTNLLTEVVNLHGVYMEIITIGVLLVGESGVGKSELAVELISRGHRLIADDAPEFRRIAPDTINGTCPYALSNFLEVRGLGIINVRELFGAGAVKTHKFLRLIVRLEHYDSERSLSVDRLSGSYSSVNVLGLEIPEITLPVAPGRNLAVLVECATRNHILRLSGYNSSDDFIKRQQKLIETGEE